MDGIFPSLLKEGRDIVFPYLVRIFRSCLATVYVAAMWHQVKVMCIPKLAKISYCGSMDFRPISLTSFLLKAMGTLLDTFVRDEIVALQLIHPKQHVHQASCGIGPSSARGTGRETSRPARCTLSRLSC